MLPDLGSSCRNASLCALQLCRAAVMPSWICRDVFATLESRGIEINFLSYPKPRLA